MVGKAALLLVMGFSLIFLIFGNSFNSVSNQAVDNYTDYYKEEVAHGLAQSGANLGASAIFQNSNWTAGYSNLQMSGGTINVNVQVLNPGQNVIEIVSLGSYSGKTDTVDVILSPSSFSKYAYYSQSEGSNIWWTANDTVFGPMHTQDNLRAIGHPVFGDSGYSTTIGGQLIYNQNANKDKPFFMGSFQSGFDAPLPSSGLQPLRDAAASGGFEIPQDSSTTTTYTTQTIGGGWQRVNGRWQYVAGTTQQIPSTSTTVDTVYMTFANDSVKIKMGYNKPTTTYNTKQIAPNGVIYAQGMDVHLQGTVQGSFSVVSDGNIYLDNDIVYKTNPNTNPNSTDMLGIIAQNDVIITDNAVNDNSINIDGSIYCQNGSFTAQNYSSRKVSGDINLLGGIIQNIRGPVGTFTTAGGSGTVKAVSGFNKRYSYDTRLLYMSPPMFPTTGGYQIVSWKE